jgi:hypothetical protein
MRDEEFLKTPRLCTRIELTSKFTYVTWDKIKDCMKNEEIIKGVHSRKEYSWK